MVKGIPVERMMIETDSPYCEIKNTHAGIKMVKSTWPSKKKERYDPESLVKGRNEPCLVRLVEYSSKFISSSRLFFFKLLVFMILA